MINREILDNPWPKNGPSFNQWNCQLSEFAKLIEVSGPFWCMDMQLKYLSLWTDTRDGSFLIFDRDKNKIDPERILKAMKKWFEETGWPKEYAA